MGGAEGAGEVRAVHQGHGRDRGVEGCVGEAVQAAERADLIADAQRFGGLRLARGGDHAGGEVDPGHAGAQPRQAPRVLALAAAEVDHRRPREAARGQELQERRPGDQLPVQVVPGPHMRRPGRGVAVPSGRHEILAHRVRPA